ncbi:MAG: hypothetical protein ACRYHQ_01790 [Janthinobacterium lividum]
MKHVKSGSVAKFNNLMNNVETTIAEKISPPWDNSGYDLIIKLGPEISQKLQKADFGSIMLQTYVNTALKSESVTEERLRRAEPVFKTLLDQYVVLRKELIAAFPKLKSVNFQTSPDAVTPAPENNAITEISGPEV